MLRCRNSEAAEKSLVVILSYRFHCEAKWRRSHTNHKPVSFNPEMQIIDSNTTNVFAHLSLSPLSIQSRFQMEEQKNFHSCLHPFRLLPSCFYIYHGYLWSVHSTCATESHTVWRIRLSYIMHSKSFSVPTCSTRWVWHFHNSSTAAATSRALIIHRIKTLNTHHSSHCNHWTHETWPSHNNNRPTIFSLFFFSLLSILAFDVGMAEGL